MTVNIVLITDTYFPIVDGVVRFVDLLARALAQTGHEVTIVAPKAPKKLYPGKAKAPVGVRLVRLPYFPVVIKDYFPTYPSFELVKTMYMSDLLIVNSLSFTTVYAQLINKVFHKPMYQFIHHDEFELAELVFKLPRLVTAFFMRSFTRMTMNMQRFGIATRKFYAKTLRFHVKPDQIFVVPFAYKVQDINSQVLQNFKNELEISKSDKVLLYLGRFTNEKNILTIIDVMAYFQSKPGITCVMVGTGYRFKSVQKRVQREKLKIKLTGRLPDEMLPYAYKVADIMVTPTFHETLCFTVVEAMHYGVVPVVNGRFKEPGLSEHNTIPITNITDVAEITGKIEEILEKPEQLTKMKNEALKISEYHNFEKFKRIWADEVAKVNPKKTH